MKFWWGLLIGIALGITGTVGTYLLRNAEMRKDGLIITFTEEEIQTRLGKKFPKSETLLEIIPVQIGVPTVRFLGGSNRVELTMDARVTVPLMPAYDAKGIFTTSVRYEQKDHTLRLSDITVERFEATNLPGKYETPLRATLTVAARKYLDDYPVHQVEQKDFKDELVKMLLKDLTVKEGRLEVKLGL